MAGRKKCYVNKVQFVLPDGIVGVVSNLDGITSALFKYKNMKRREEAKYRAHDCSRRQRSRSEFRSTARQIRRRILIQPSRDAGSLSSVFLRSDEYLSRCPWLTGMNGVHGKTVARAPLTGIVVECLADNLCEVTAGLSRRGFLFRGRLSDR